MVTRTAYVTLVGGLLCGLAACSPDADTAAKSNMLGDKEAQVFFEVHVCNACHAVDELRIGPAYRDVAIRYSEDDREMRVGALAQKIIHGGAGSWGNVPMVTNPKVTPAEASAIARWILALDTERK
tara:strand:+ start:4905 stop:5282 length:378 start_codon:yes stop_codon:yes gene_type:complete